MTTCNTACLQSWQDYLSRACGKNHSLFPKMRWVSTLEFSKTFRSKTHFFVGGKWCPVFVVHSWFFPFFFFQRRNVKPVSQRPLLPVQYSQTLQANDIWPGFRCDCFESLRKICTFCLVCSSKDDLNFWDLLQLKLDAKLHKGQTCNFPPRHKTRRRCPFYFYLGKKGVEGFSWCSSHALLQSPI